MGALRGLGLVGLLLVVGIAPALAERKSDETSPEKRLWARYQEIRKVSDVVNVRQRTALARQLAEIGSPQAQDHLQKIFTRDKALGPRLAAMEALCTKGDLKTVKKVTSKAKAENSGLRLWVGAMLGKAEDEAVRKWILGRSGLLKDARTRLGAIEALTSLQAEEARVPLMKLYAKYEKKESQAPLVYETLRALAAIGGKGVRELLLEAAGTKQAWKRLAAAECLLSLEDTNAACRAAVRKLLEDEDGLVREAAVEAIGSLEDETCVPDLIARLSDERLRIRPKAQAALVKITDLDIGYDKEAWTSWWKWHHDGQKQTSDAITIPSDKVYRIFSNGVLFLLDTSKSMSWQAPKATNRIDVARAQLLELIDELDESTPFNVIAVTGRHHVWKPARGREGCLVPATAKNKNAARKWIEGLECGVYTNSWTALEAAIGEYPSVDTIYYITDGELPETARVPFEEIPLRLKEINRLRKVVVHVRFLNWGPLMKWAVPFENREEQQTWLEEVAQQTGGTFEAQWQP